MDRRKRLSHRGGGKKLLLLGRVSVYRRRGIGGFLVGCHSIHHKHGKHQHQQTGNTDGEGQPPQGLNRLAAAGTAGRSRGKGLDAAGAAIGFRLLKDRLGGMWHVSRSIYHRRRACGGTSTGYNRRVRIVSTFLLIFGLAGCHRGVESNDAVRQGVLDYLATKGMTAAAMDINVSAVKFNGDKADATVSFAAKGTGVGQMTIQYHLALRDNKWAVVGRQDAGQHGAGQVPPGGAMPGGAMPGGAMPGGAMPAGANPHGMMAPGAGGKMPAPEDLPPAGKKK